MQRESGLNSACLYMQAACKNAPDSDDAKRAVDLLYDTALISSGFTVRINNIFFFKKFF
jgi:HSP90 family molecular chaperone